MERSEQAQAFLESLDQDDLKVSDGSDGLPVWIGIDPEAGKVYKVYASGLAQGFGDGQMMIINGIRFAVGHAAHAEQATFGRHMLLSSAGGVEILECDARPRITPENLERARMLVKLSEDFGLPLSGSSPQPVLDAIAAVRMERRSESRARAVKLTLENEDFGDADFSLEVAAVLEAYACAIRQGSLGQHAVEQMKAASGTELRVTVLA